MSTAAPQPAATSPQISIWHGSPEEERDARSLFVVWQDAGRLGSFLGEAHLSEKDFREVPLSRSTPLHLLAGLAAHVAAMRPDLVATTSAPREVWERILSMTELTEDAIAPSVSQGLLGRAWQAFTADAPALWHALANDVRVVRMRTRWDLTMARPPEAWPQPLASHVDPSGDAARLAAVAAEAMEGVPATRLWHFHPAAIDPAAPAHALGAAVERERTFDYACLLSTRASLERLLGDPVELVPQDQVYPLIWDAMVADETLVWERERDSSA